MVSSTMSPSTNLPWVEKYRPTQLDELVAHKEIITTITSFIDRKALPHLLFYGPPGTGKTTTILACARRMYSPSEMSALVLELNASDDRGIGVVREQILNFVSSRQLTGGGVERKLKLVLLDEADAMTRDAQNALRRIIEKYTDNVRFCLICNYLSKIIPALQSRCTRFRFAPLDQSLMLPRLRFVAEKEGVKMSSEGEQALISLAHGDMRKVLNVLQSTWLAFDDVTEATVYSCVGQPHSSQIDKITQSLLNDSVAGSYKLIRGMMTESGLALQDIITGVHRSVIKLELGSPTVAYLEVQLAEVEHRLSRGAHERLQMGALIAMFMHARSTMHKHAQKMKSAN